MPIHNMKDDVRVEVQEETYLFRKAEISNVVNDRDNDWWTVPGSNR